MPETIEAPKGSSVLDDLQIVPSPEYGKVEEVKEDLPTVEDTTSPVVPEVKIPPVEVTPPAGTPKARENFAKLEAAKKEAEERANKIEQEWTAKYNDAQTKLREYEERISKAGNPDDYLKQIQERDQRLQQLDTQLRTVALERHPDFIAKYEEPKKHYLDSAQEIALASGISKDEFAMALSRPDKLQEIRESLPLQEQYGFDAAFRSIRELELQRSAALKNKDHAIEQISRQQQEVAIQRQQQITQQNLEAARRMAMEPFEKIPGLKDDQELQKDVQATLEAIAGGPGAERWGIEDILRLAASARVAPKIIQSQQAQLEEVRKQLEETQKKLTERDTFIQEKYGSLPSNEVPGGKPAEEKRSKPIYEDIIVRVG